MTMSMPLLPEWMRLLWGVVCLGVAATHYWHAASMRGQPRWWHAGHTVMALGMLAMYLIPHATTHPVVWRAGLLLFLLVAVVHATAAMVLRRREGMLNPLWVFATVDALVMVYMVALPMSGPPAVTSVLAGYLTVQVAAWACGVWGRVSFHHTGPAGQPDALPAGGVAEAVVPARAAVGLPAEVDAGVRAGLALMTAGMGYMLVAGLV
jgi:hypothetical protein